VWIFGAPVPGSLVWLALGYAAAGTLVTHWLGRSLIRLNFLKQKAEADFRFGLVRARESAESIAFYGGEANEIDGLEARFSRIVANWRQIMTVTKRMMFFASGYTQAALVFPLAIVAPAYFAGRIPLGGIFQSASAFVKVQESLSWLISNYSTVARWSATVSRLDGFVVATAAEPGPGAGLVRERGGDRLIVSDVNIWTPEGVHLLCDACLVVGRGERVLLRGPSGIGKSTLLRALAGLWPEMSGRIVMPEGTRMFLPQKPYLPTGSLRRAAIYPIGTELVDDADIVRCLRKAGLSHLVAHLDRDDIWSSKLSGGESQRLALARVLILRPDWLFLDEATANLDLAGEASFYRLIELELPNVAFVSVAHRPQVEAFHSRVIELLDRKLQEAGVPNPNMASSRTDVPEKL
jgi:putative ATP-binding cassette transporter